MKIIYQFLNYTFGRWLFRY